MADGSDTGVRRASVAWADMDGDGDSDLAVTGQDEEGDARFIVFENDGSGNLTKFDEPMGANDGLQFSSIAWADMDGDTDPDLAASGADSSRTRRLIVFENDGSGNLTIFDEPMANGSDTGVHRSSIAWSDMDGDGDPDLAVTGEDMEFADRFILFENDGSGNLSLFDEPMGTDNGVSFASLAWANVDGDTDPDLVISGDNYGTPRLILFKNDGAGNLTLFDEPLGSTNGLSSSSLAWSDMDGDGDPDLAATGNDQNADRRFFLFQNDGSGSLSQFDQPLGSVNGLANSSISWANIDGDTPIELAVTGGDANFDRRFILFENDGSGNLSIFDEPLSSNGGLGSSSLAWADMDADGDLDLVAAGGDTDSVRRLLLFANPFFVSSSGGGSGGGGGSCLVGRYGPSAVTSWLRGLRDRLLLHTTAGRKLTDTYYRWFGA